MMWPDRIRMPGRATRSLVAVMFALAALALAAGPPLPAPEPVASAPAEPLPGSLDTRTSLDAVFTSEMNAKQRYERCARQAMAEGYPAAAAVFRACARAEEVHANRHVQAIAWMGGEARALLAANYISTTLENLQESVDNESYEAGVLYPALYDRARAEHQTMAMRSMNFARSAEREHAALLTQALLELDRHPPPATLYVCPLCGKTVESLDFRKCPNCFTTAGRFVKLG